MLMALTLDNAGSFMLRLAVMMAGVFVIAYLTPKLAGFIDKQRSKNSRDEQPSEPLFKSPYESAPLPKRVESETLTENKRADSNIIEPAEDMKNTR